MAAIRHEFFPDARPANGRTATPLHRYVAAVITLHRHDRVDNPRQWRIALFALVCTTVAIRAVYFGNPLIDSDEQFYLLVGDRLLHGALPYVDIFDRKPIGLFLLYGGMRALGGTGVLAYQLVAAGFVAATAVVIATIARKISSPTAAIVVALAYVPALAIFGGEGGQAPVFYNLPVALAALFVMRGLGQTDTGRLRRDGTVAMLLIGIALQIKYSAVFEGVFFGMTLLWLSWRAEPRAGARLADALLWIGAALLPTILATAWYAAIGHFGEYMYANFWSIFARGSYDHQGRELLKIIVRLCPFLLPIAIGEWLLRPFRWWLRGRSKAGQRYRFVVGWALAAVLGFAAFGTFFNHYALPLLVPLAILVAPTIDVRFRGAGVVMAAILLLAVFIPYPIHAVARARYGGDATDAKRMVDAIRPELKGGCLYVFFGDPILYQLTGSCLPTRWAFPYHLSLTRERDALGVNPATELRRILANRPPVIVDRVTRDDQMDPRMHAMLQATLARDYHLIAQDRLRRDTNRIWALNRR